MFLGLDVLKSEIAVLRSSITSYNGAINLVVEDITVSCHKSLEALDTLLSMEQIDLGLTQLERTLLPLNKLLNEAMEPYIRQAMSSGLSFEFESGGPNQLAMTDLSTVMVNVDKNRMTQAIRILLDNAFRYTPKNGKVTVAVERAVNGSEISDLQCLRIVIADTGKGVTQDQLTNMFKVFPLKNVTSGTSIPGVGLWGKFS